MLPSSGTSRQQWAGRGSIVRLGQCSLNHKHTNRASNTEELNSEGRKGIAARVNSGQRQGLTNLLLSLSLKRTHPATVKIQTEQNNRSWNAIMEGTDGYAI